LHYQYNIKEKLRFQSNAKWNYSYLRYLDPDYLNVEGKLDNKYWQREFYVSNAVLYEATPKLSLSLSNDLFLNDMHTSMEDFPLPYRYTSLTAASTLFRLKKFSLSATLLHSYIYDIVKSEDKGTFRHRLNPSFHISYQPIEKKSFYIEAFYKNIFRMPTFNDLYYRLVGNTNLKPERTQQFDVGVKWVEYINVLLPYVSLSADVYHNMVNDKIIAVPNKNLFVWSMINLGKVLVTGVNVQAMVEMKYHRHIQTEYMINYTYQYVVDISDEKAKNYKHQIPYTPKHSVSVVVVLKTKWIHVSYSLLYVGERYMLGQNTDDNALLPYLDQGIAVYRGFTIKETHLTLGAEMLNMCNKQYEVVKNYPMPGRHFQIKVSFKF
jgi:outer membrane cobalamin receptor